MIWVAWRRHRLLLALFAGLLVGLGVWMILLAHAFDHASNVCRNQTYQCGFQYGIVSVENQATAINALLLLLPCLAGIVFGAPLVAGELEHYTNRLVWTQGISRTRWFITKWVVVGLILGALTSLLMLITQYWSGHVFARLPLSVALHGRIQPTLFAVTGVAPVAYTLFAFSLGAALGAIIRRTSWAVVATIVGYTAVALLMVFSIRPNLASQGFMAETRSTSVQYVALPTPQPWMLGYGFRFAPSTRPPTGAESASAIAQRCMDQKSGGSYIRCLSAHDVEGGFSYQPASHYWALQWGEAAIYFASALVLFGLALLAVRRWRA